MLAAGARSGERSACLRCAYPALPPGNPPQLALDRAGAREQAAIHSIEMVIGRVEHEAARNSDRDADGATIELD